MRITVHLVNGSHVSIENMDTDTVQPMIEALSDDETKVIALSLDGEAMTYILKRNIVRVDVD
ncbi:MAG TPA: hypothetical protein VFH56_16870 [Acidimicrobiales bacterium]|nr:hypothetical protein [Acidimicrobiales bacterium]